MSGSTGVTMSDGRTDGPAPTPEPTLSAVLARLGDELDGASKGLKTVQEALVGLPKDCLSQDAMICLQRLDLLEQTARGLAQVVAGASRLPATMSQPFPLDLLKNCSLSSLADRLAGIEPEHATPFELF